MRWVELDWLGDAELLSRIGRAPLARVLAMLGPFLGQQGLNLPEADLSDLAYFEALAALCRAQPLKLLAYLPPCLEAGFKPGAPGSPGGNIGATLSTDCALYALRWDGTMWRLTFASLGAAFPPGVAVLHVAHMLGHPNALVAAARLGAQARRLGLAAGGSPAMPGMSDGSTPAEAGSVVEEMPYRIGDAKTLRALRRKHAELLAIVESDQACEPEKAEAQREMDENEKLQHEYLGRFQGSAGKAAHAVRKSIYRFHGSLLRPPRGQREPDPVLVRFADHLEQHLLKPSRRYAGLRGRLARAELTGCLIYEPPPGVRWVL